MMHFSQAAVIPYRIKKDRVHVLLITNRSGKRWILPKGLVDEGEDAAEAAAREAEEEAGIVGAVHPEALGSYTYPKWGGFCDVEVYLLRVEGMLDHWEEESFRKRSWFKPAEAAELLREPELIDWVLDIEEQIKQLARTGKQA